MKKKKQTKIKKLWKGYKPKIQKAGIELQKIGKTSSYIGKGIAKGLYGDLSQFTKPEKGWHIPTKKEEAEFEKKKRTTFLIYKYDGKMLKPFYPANIDLKKGDIVLIRKALPDEKEYFKKENN